MYAILVRSVLYWSWYVLETYIVIMLILSEAWTCQAIDRAYPLDPVPLYIYKRAIFTCEVFFHTQFPFFTTPSILTTSLACDRISLETSEYSSNGRATVLYSVGCGFDSYYSLQVVVEHMIYTTEKILSRFSTLRLWVVFYILDMLESVLNPSKSTSLESVCR